MATPQMIVQQPFVQIKHKSPNSIRVDTFNPDGTVLDVHTGYTVDELVAWPTTGYNPLPGGTDISTYFTPTFDTTGVTLNATQANTTALEGVCPVFTMSFRLGLTNDSGTTQSTAALGTISLDQAGIMF